MFDLNTVTEANVSMLKTRILKDLNLSREVMLSVDDFLDLYECEWFINTRISNFIVNSVRVYDFLGVRWRIPMWDSEYTSLWYSLPWKMKYNSVLYNRFMFEYYFKPLKIDFVKSKTGLISLLKSIAKLLLPNKIKQKYRERVKKTQSGTNKSHYNGFEFVINYIYSTIDIKEFEGLDLFNKGNINAPISLYYINLLKQSV